MLKLSTLTLTVLIPIFSFAGTHGGGVVSSVANDGGTVGDGILASVIENTNDSVVLSPKEIVFHMGQNNGLVKFAYAQLINKQWDIKEVTLPVSEISNDESAVKALDESRSLNQWVELK